MRWVVALAFLMQAGCLSGFAWEAWEADSGDTGDESYPLPSYYYRTQHDGGQSSASDAETESDQCRESDE